MNNRFDLDFDPVFPPLSQLDDDFADFNFDLNPDSDYSFIRSIESPIVDNKPNPEMPQNSPTQTLFPPHCAVLPGLMSEQQRERAMLERVQQKRALQLRVQQLRVQQLRVQQLRAQQLRVQQLRAQRERAQLERTLPERAQQLRAQQERAQQDIGLQHQVIAQQHLRLQKQVKAQKEIAQQVTAEQVEAQKKRAQQERLKIQIFENNIMLPKEQTKNNQASYYTHDNIKLDDSQLKYVYPLNGHVFFQDKKVYCIQNPQYQNPNHQAQLTTQNKHPAPAFKAIIIDLTEDQKRPAEADTNPTPTKKVKRV